MSANGGAVTRPVSVTARLEALRHELAATEAASLAAHAALRSGTGDADAVARGEARAAVLRTTIADLEQQATQEAEERCRTDAEARLTAIRRAHGSLMAQYEEDVARLQEAAAGFVDAGSRVSERAGKLRMLAAEQNALLDRFPALSAPALPPVTAPGRHEGVVAAVRAVDSVGFRDHLHVASAAEDDAHKLRRRRSYAEISGTPGGEIIKVAGLRPWPELTAQQRQVIAGRQRDKEQEAVTLRRFAAEADRSRERSTL